MAALSFDEVIAITPTDTPYVFTGRLHEKQWSIGQAPHGGLLTALCLKSATTALQYYETTKTQNSTSSYPHPLTSTLHFLRVAGYGTRYFHVQINKTSKQYAHVTVIMTEQKHRTPDDMIIMTNAWFGNLYGNPQGWKHEAKGTTLDMTSVKPRTQIRNQMEGVPSQVLETLSLYKSIDLRYETHDDNKERAWLTFQDGRPTDDLWSVLFATDALVPHPVTIVEYQEAKKIRTGKYWCPTMTFDLVLHGLPAKGNSELFVEFQTILAHNGTFEETCKTYGVDGKLLVSARQFAGIMSMERAVAKPGMTSKL
jgi:hypothetical protein